MLPASSRCRGRDRLHGFRVCGQILSVLLFIGAARWATPSGRAGAQAGPGRSRRLRCGNRSGNRRAVDCLKQAGAALGRVEFIARLWRLPGNAGYDPVPSSASAAGSAAAGSRPRGESRPTAVEEYPARDGAWTTRSRSRHRPAGAERTKLGVVRRDKERLHGCCINSFSTDGRRWCAPLGEHGRRRRTTPTREALRGRRDATRAPVTARR